MSEERTQSPTPRMRQLAREQGVVALSGDLTSSLALFAASLLLGAIGGGIVTELAHLTEAAFKAPFVSATEQKLLAPAASLFVPLIQNLLMFLGGSALAAVLAHQMQAQGVWNPGRIAPDFSRLMPTNRKAAARGFWNLLKTFVILTMGCLLIRDRWPELEPLSKLEAIEAWRQGASIVAKLLTLMAGVLVGLALFDFGFQYWRVERMLMQTPEAQREDLKAVEGDPSIRSRRRRLASDWRTDSPHLLSGASMVIEGRGDLVVVLRGGPPPKKVTIGTIAGGPAGRRLSQHALERGVPIRSAPVIARKLARRRPSGAALPSDLTSDLEKVWSAPDQSTI